jgi:hypothetical protein
MSREVMMEMTPIEMMSPKGMMMKETSITVMIWMMS